MERKPKTEISEKEAKKRFDELQVLSRIIIKFMKVERATLHADGRTHENDGEHTLHAMFLAVAYARKYNPELDSGRIAELIMVHDLVEVYAGDTVSLTADTARMNDKKEREISALVRLEEELGDVFPAIIKLIEEYESLNSEEARFAKAFEKIDPAFTHIANDGVAFQKIGITSKRQHDDLFEANIKKTLDYAAPDLVKIRREGHERARDVTTYQDL